MTSYFDDRRSLFRGKSLDEAMAMEREMIGQISELVADPQFPEEWRQRFHGLVGKWFLDKPDGVEWFTMMGEPNLVDELHSLFHRIGGARIQTRFGILSDNPLVSLTDKRAWEVEHGETDDGKASGPEVP